MLNAYYRPYIAGRLSRSVYRGAFDRLRQQCNRWLSTTCAGCCNEKSSYFITTPIFYVNAAPHIGHLYTAVLADALARWHRLLGDQVVFSTGTDEHGLKIQQAANQTGQQPEAFCDQVSGEFKRLFQLANVEHTDYIRTTEERHRAAVEHFWRSLYDKGYIYKGSYQGWYSTSDEAFLTEDQVTELTDKDGQTIKVAKESGQPVDWTSEDNYVFRLSQFGPKLLQWIDGKVIKPVNFEPLLRAWIAEGLPDLSVSRHRDRLHWGIPVPDDPSQTIYVWLDALVNYLTVGGYPRGNHVWPADCHIIGKDILRFHAVYWPAFLMAAGMQPPRSILCHSHWLLDDHKMSKSRGNVVDPFESIERYSADGIRYFLLREGVPHSDSNFGERKVVECLNSEVVNTLGNLLNRCTSDAVNPQQCFPSLDCHLFHDRATEADRQLWVELQSLPERVKNHYDNCEIYKALEDIMGQLRGTNGFVQSHKPWELRKKSEELPWLQSVLHVTMETLRVCSILLQPVTPSLSERILSRLNVPAPRRAWHDIAGWSVMGDRKLGPSQGPLFQRIIQN